MYSLYYNYFDLAFLALVIPAMIVSVIAQIRIKSTFSKYSKVKSTRGITGAQAADRVLSHYGVSDVRIERVSGNLTDHFDPRTKVIRLSESVYDSTSVAAIGVACHEAGHAAQHAEGYTPIRIRNAIIPICNIGSSLGLPLAVFGLILAIDPLVTIGLMLYALIAVFQLATLPVEFNASKRAVSVIDESGLLYDEEQIGAKKVLRAAAMTYVAALIMSLANLLRFIIRFGGRSRRN